MRKWVAIGLVATALSACGEAENAVAEKTMHVYIKDFGGDGPQQLQVRDENDKVIGTATVQMGTNCFMSGCDASVDVVVPEVQFYEVLLEGAHLQGWWTTTISFEQLESSGWIMTLDSGSGYPGPPTG